MICRICKQDFQDLQDFHILSFCSFVVSAGIGTIAESRYQTQP